jgi:Ca2+-binding EF-hand superfamily protein/diacylglycerol kinase family enzyme
LNWGPGYAGEDLAPILNKVRAGRTINMDRWKAVFEGLPEGDKPRESILNAYLGLGVDAEIALKFHTLREEMPGLFRSRTLNKLIYGQLGFTSMLTRHEPFCKIVELELDGKVVEIPSNLTGILLLNLPSWGGGSNPWGLDNYFPGKTWSPQVIDDSKIEILGFTGAFHLAQIQTNLQYGIRIAQAQSVRLTTKQALPVQVDGEAWVMNPCSIKVSLLNKTKVLIYETKGDNYKVPTKPLDARTRVEIKELGSMSFSVEKLEHIKKQLGTSALKKAEFVDVMNQLTGIKFDEKNPVLTERLFHIFDTDKSGTVDAKELSVGLSILSSGALEAKLKFVFDLFDTKNTGRITRDQLTSTFKTLFSMLYAGEADELVKIYVNVLLELYDQNKDGTITLDELIVAAKNDEVLAHLFTFGASLKHE